MEFAHNAFFNNTNFYEHKFSITVLDSCFRVTFISGNENHKLHDIFHDRQVLLFMVLSSSFLKFSENYNNETT